MPTSYGAAFDVRGAYDAVVSGGTLSTVTSATAAFVAGDTGKTYTLASTSGAVTKGTLTYVSATSCTMSTAAGGAMTGARLIFGTDDTAAWQAALNAALPGQTVMADNASFRSLCTGHLTVPDGVHLGVVGIGPFDPATNPAMNTWGPTFVVVQDSTAFITLGTGSGLGDFIIYSANQVTYTSPTPTAFAPLIYMPNAGSSIGRPYLPNAYIGISIKGGRHFIDGPQIGSLYRGVIADSCYDYVHVRTITHGPYWFICEGAGGWAGPQAGTLDEYVLTNAWVCLVSRADAFHIGEITSYCAYGGLILIDSSVEPTSKCPYVILGMADIDLCAYGIVAYATQPGGLLVGSLHSAGNATGVGTGGQAAVATEAGGSVAPKVVVKSWGIWGTFANNSYNGAGTLIVPTTNPG
jgi:hypothetical protein